MWRIASVALLAACSPTQPESLRTIAAVEIPADGAADREDVIEMLRRYAEGGLEVVDSTETWREVEALPGGTPPPGQRGTIFVDVWRDDQEGHPEIDVRDTGHPGRIWMTFQRGTRPELAAEVRARLLAQIRRRWPGAQALPVLPSGGLPLHDDLRMTSEGYRIARSKAPVYELPPSSPLLTDD